MQIGLYHKYAEVECWEMLDQRIQILVVFKDYENALILYVCVFTLINFHQWYMTVPVLPVGG